MRHSQGFYYIIHSKRNILQGDYIIGFFHLPEKNLPAEKHYNDKWDYYPIQKHVIKEMGPKVGCFAGFCHHRLMSAHMLAYHYPLFESGTKAGLRVITLCRKDRVLLSKHK